MARPNLGLQKHTLNLYIGDFDKLNRFFPDADTSVIIRDLIHDLVVRMEAKEQKMPDVNIPLKI